ncbi:MAG: anti-sigma factor antagonist [Bacilli bacterium]|nr:anti-sigma factor antagonist [Bacilli bacterium]
MESEITNGVLTIRLSGQLDSNNAPAIQDEIFQIAEGASFDSVVLDLGRLEYISSAGLRVVLKMKHAFKNVSVVEVSSEVYQIFDMTGFTEMIPVKKALKVVDVSGAELIGEGYCSYVYRLDKDTIIKVFKFATDTSDVERELNLAKQAFVLGIPTAISFDIVKVGDKFGVRFEMLDCKSLRDLIRDEPENFPQYKKSYAGLLKKIGETESMNDNLPNIKDGFFERLEIAKDDLDPAIYEKLHAFISSIPERKTFVHGDCHVKNIMVRDGEFFLIDMDTLSRGHPIFEYALLSAPYVIFEQDDPGNSLRFFGLDGQILQDLFDAVLREGFGDAYSPEAIDQVMILGYVHMLWWYRKNEPQAIARFESSKRHLIDLVEKYPDLGFCA